MKHHTLFLFASLLSTAVANSASAKQMILRYKESTIKAIFVFSSSKGNNFKQGKAEEASDCA